MAFYKSKYTGIEIDQRLTQATYDDAVLAGFEGSKEEFDAILGKLKEIADKAENSIQPESENLETFNKNIVDAINELHRELQAKPDEQDVIDQGELEVFKDEIAAKYATKEELEEINGGSLIEVNQAIQQNAETIAAEINQRKEADTELDSKITQEISDRQATDDQLSERIETLENAGYQNADQVKAEIEKIVGTAPEALDTLKEIGDALNNDPNFATTITNELSKKADKTDLDTKVDWVNYNNTKNIVLPSNGQVFGDFGGEESNSSLLGARIYNAGLENEEKQVEVGTSKVHLNLNSLDRPSVETPDGKENLVLESDIKLIPTEVNFPVRTSGGSDGPEDRIYTQDEILEWFGVADVATLKKQIANKGIQYIKYGIMLMGNPYYYKMPIQYAAFESANQIKLVFIGLNTNNDVASKYEIIINLDGTIIEGNSNVKVTITSIESEDINLSEYATKEELNDYALKSELPKQHIVEEGAALQAGDEQHEFNIKSGGRVTVNSNNEVVTYTPYPGEEGRKMLVLANNDSLTGTKTDGTGAPLVFMSKWDKIEIGNSTTSLNLNSLNGEITINDDKIVATVDQIPETYDDTQLRNELQQTETGVATANTEIEKLKSGKQSIQDETLQTTNKTVVGAINELLTKIQELETKNTELESRIAALEGAN